MSEITREKFIEAVGREPKEDDLERCNCKTPGKIGHLLCGWCYECNLPIFICGHEYKYDDITKQRRTNNE